MEVPPSSTLGSLETILQHANSITKQAVEEDQAQNWSSALRLYTNALQLFILVLKNEPDETKSVTLRFQIGELMNRAEYIKKSIASQVLPSPDPPPTQTPPTTTQSAPETIETPTIELLIQKVECYVTSTTGGKPLLIADGSKPLQVLKVSNKTILEIGPDFAYELNESIPCLALKAGYYVLPGIDGQNYGIIFPKNIPDVYYNLFEEKLQKHCMFKKNSSIPSPCTIEEPESDEENNSEIIVDLQSPTGGSGEDDVHIWNNQNQKLAIVNKIENRLSTLVTDADLLDVASKVDFGGKVISHGILKGGEYLEKTLRSNSQKLKEHIQPTEKPIEIPESIRRSLEVAKTITPHFVTFSDTVISGVSVFAKEMAGTASDYVVKKMNEKTGKNSDEIPDPRITAAKELGKAGFVAAVTIWNSLEEAGMNLFTSTGDVVVDLINHKFGANAGDTIRDGFLVAQDVVKTTQSIQSFGVKGITKKVVKQSTKSFARNVFEGIPVETTTTTTEVTEIEDPLELEDVMELPKELENKENLN